MQQPRIEIWLTLTTNIGDHKVITTSSLDIDDVPMKLGTYARLRRGHLMAAQAAATTGRPSPHSDQEASA
jgi:hypothetical protein